MNIRKQNPNSVIYEPVHALAGSYTLCGIDYVTFNIGKTESKPRYIETDAPVSCRSCCRLIASVELRAFVPTLKRLNRKQRAALEAFADMLEL